MSGQVLIFDFDGTLCDGFDAVVDIINALAKEHGLVPIADERRAALRDLPSEGILAAAGIVGDRVPLILRLTRAALHDRIASLAPPAGLSAALTELHAAGAQLGIVTSNQEETVRAFLQRHAMPPFDFMACGSSVFGKGEDLRQLVTRRGITRDATYVGDETRDVDAARHAGIRAAGVTWGFCSAAAFAHASPDVLLSSPHELLRVLA